MLPPLQHVLENTPLGKETYLETAYGQPFTAPGFGNWFRTQCDAAGLTKCSAHGLRKMGRFEPLKMAQGSMTLWLSSGGKTRRWRESTHVRLLRIGWLSVRLKMSKGIIPGDLRVPPEG